MMSHKQNMVQIRITVHHSNTGVCRSKVKKKMVLITQWAIMSSQVTNQTLKDDLTDLHRFLAQSEKYRVFQEIQVLQSRCIIFVQFIKAES